MPLFEYWSVWLAGTTIAIGIIGLGGLFWYANETRKIAKATKLQGDVLSRPTIALSCGMDSTITDSEARIPSTESLFPFHTVIGAVARTLFNNFLV